MGSLPGTPRERLREALHAAEVVLEHMVIGPCEGKHDPATLSDAAQRRFTALGYVQEARKALAEIGSERLVEALRLVEWNGFDATEVGDICGACSRYRDEGHADDCLVGKALALEGSGG